MTRLLVIIAVVGFVVATACFAGVAALGGQALAAGHWPVPWHGNWDWDDDDSGPSDDHAPNAVRDIAWNGGESLEIALPADVVYTQGPVTKLTVTGPKAAVDQVVVDGDRLRLMGHRSRHMGWSRHGARLQVAIASPNTHAFALLGSPNLKLAGFNQDRLDIDVKGSGDVTGAGQAKRVTIAIFGSGDADLAGVPSDEAEVKIMGSGRAAVAPKAYADIAIFGSGDVDLSTRPAKLESKLMGSGKIHQHDAAAVAATP